MSYGIDGYGPRRRPLCRPAPHGKGPAPEVTILLVRALSEEAYGPLNEHDIAAIAHMVLHTHPDLVS